jgi:hypothetical protein
MKNPTKELMAIPPEDWLEEADRRERAGDKQGAKTARQFARFLMGQKNALENPARRPKESPLYVKYLSLKSDEEPFMMQGTKYEYVWAEYPGGVKDIGVYSYANDLVYSYDSFRQMMNLPNPLKRRKGESVRDFTSRCMSEEKASFPKTKQRIAVCLSKSRKRNPLESGANISDDQDINVQASNMG